MASVAQVIGLAPGPLVAFRIEIILHDFAIYLFGFQTKELLKEYFSDVYHVKITIFLKLCTW